MADPFDVRAVRGIAPGDSLERRLNESMRLNESVRTARPTDLDGEHARKVHRQLLQWYWYERDKQAANRLEMAMDADFYDGLQWDPEDAADSITMYQGAPGRRAGISTMARSSLTQV